MAHGQTYRYMAGELYAQYGRVNHGNCTSLVGGQSYHHMAGLLVAQYGRVNHGNWSLIHSMDILTI